jgi:hypothetical protein
MQESSASISFLRRLEPCLCTHCCPADDILEVLGIGAADSSATTTCHRFYLQMLFRRERESHKCGGETTNAPLLINQKMPGRRQETRTNAVLEQQFEVQISSCNDSL